MTFTRAVFPLTAARVQMLRAANEGGAEISALDFELIDLWETVTPYLAEVVDAQGGTRADLILAHVQPASTLTTAKRSSPDPASGARWER